MPSRTMEKEGGEEEWKYWAERGGETVSASWIRRILAKSSDCCVSKEAAMQLSSQSRS